MKPPGGKLANVTVNRAVPYHYRILGDVFIKFPEEYVLTVIS